MFYAHHTDAEDRITRLEGDWEEFARRNWRPDFSPEMVLGRDLWDFIDGRATQEAYRLAVGRVRQGGRSLSLPFRCDSPAIRRFMELTIAEADDGGLAWRCYLVREEPRSPLPPRPGPGEPGGRRLVACSLCLRLEKPAWTELDPAALPAAAAWLEAEQLLPVVASLGQGYFPPLAYQLCPDCRGRLAASG